MSRIAAAIRKAGPLPAAAILPELDDAMRGHGCAVVTAPPGSGKTTLLPLALLDAGWLAGRRILMAEPRRLATRQAAARMADLLGEMPGGTIGYAMRFERRISAATRIEIVTEGLLLRRLQADPGLEDYGLVIFDEIHERSLEGDLGLALAGEARTALRDDLRLLAMSATVDAREIARAMGDAPVIEASGRMFDVQTHHRPPAPGERMEGTIARIVHEALGRHAGSILVFLPGASEIRRTANAIGRLPDDTDLFMLAGELSRDRQDAAIAPAPPGRRKIVLATNIAETSLTIDGIEVVIDSGAVRRSRFSTRTGMSRLETLKASRASVDQRRGRAGRLGPGHCYRAWSVEDERGLAPFDPPAILEADLAPLALELAAWGSSDPAWITPPPAGAMAGARQLLADLGALDDEGRITAHGRLLAGMPCHPRLAHMLALARKEGLANTALAIASLLEGRDPWRAKLGADLPARLARWNERTEAGPELRRLERQLGRALSIKVGMPRPEAAGACLALAFPDRIGRRRESGAAGFQLTNGRGVMLQPPDLFGDATWLAVAEVDDSGTDGRIRLAAPLDEATAETLSRTNGRTERRVYWDDDARAVRAIEEMKLGALTIRSRPWRNAPAESMQTCLLLGIRRVGIEGLPLRAAERGLLARLRFLHRHQPESWPDLSDEALLGGLEDWLLPWLDRQRSLADLAGLDFDAILRALAGHHRRGEIDRLAPIAISTPAGRKRTIDYETDPPSLRVPLQEMFGSSRHPAILDGAVPLVLHLLSPAGRPVQVTRDIEGFWKGSYQEVRRDLRGRYPKHPWPEVPQAATPWVPGRRRQDR